MTKTIKRSLLAVLLFVVAFAGSFAFVSFNAYADEAKVNAFVAAMDVVEEKGITTADDTSILADAEKVTAINDAKIAYDKLSATEKAAEAIKGDIDTFEAIYNKVLLDADTIILYNNTEIYELVLGIDGAKVTYSQKAKFEERKADYANLDSYEKAYVDAKTNEVEYFDGMEAAFATIEGSMDDAKAEIEDIQAYAEGAWANFVNGTNLIVVSSADSIDEATAALKAIYGVEYKDLDKAEKDAIEAYIGNAFANYKAAIAAYAQIKLDVAALATEINETYDAVLANESYYDDADKITTLKAKFDANKNEAQKVDSALVNDYTSLIEAEVANKVQALVDGLAAINTKIDNIKSRIADLTAQKAVDTANGIYTVDCKTIIYGDNGVEEQFEALESYVQENIATIVDTWAGYVADKAAYDAAAKAVQDLIDAIDAIIADDSNIVDDFDAASKLYATFVPNQTAEFNGTEYGEELGGVVMDYYLNAYKYVQAQAGKVAVKAAEFATKIDNLTYEFSVEFYATITALNEEFKALDENVQNAVTNYNVLKGYIDKYISELGGADGWKAAVDLIAVNGEIPTITYAIAKDIVAGPVALWTALDATLQGVVATDSEENPYYATYVIYVQLANTAEAVLALVEDAQDKVAAIDVTATPDVGQPTTDFVNAFHAAETALAKLTAGVVGEVNYDISDALATVFTTEGADYYDEYQNYLVAEKWCETFDIEAAIDGLYEGDATIESARANVKYGIRAALEELEAEYTAELEGRRDYYINKLAFARQAYDEKAAEVNAWILRVAQMIDAEATKDTMSAIIADASNVAGLLSVDLSQEVNTDEGTIVYDLEAMLASDAQTLEDLAPAIAKLEAIFDQGKDVVDQLNADIDEINALAKITPEYLDLINSIEYRYSNIHETQRALIDTDAYNQFKTAYNKANFQKFYVDAVEKLQAEVDAEVFTVEGATLVSVLQSMYNSVSPELQGLVTNEYLALDDVAAAYAEANVDAYVYAKLQAAIDAVANELGDFKLDVDGIKDDLEDLIKANEDAIDALEQDLNDKINALVNGKVSVEDFNDAIAQAAQDLADAKQDITDAYTQAIKDAIDALRTELTDAYKDADELITDAYEAADDALDKAYKAADAILQGNINDLSDALDEAVDALEKALADAVDALEAADKALQDALDKEIADREAADKALEDKLMAEISSLNTKLVVASVVLAVFTAALIAAVVYIFIKKKD